MYSRLWQLMSGRVILISGVILLAFLLLAFHVSSSAGISPLNLTNSSIRGHHALLQDASNRTLGFQKIFVINLPSRTDHRDSTSLAAALTGLDLEYVDGVLHIENKTLPPMPEKAKLGKGALGAYRAHLNAVRLVVEQGLSSALVMEDDVDWDIRVHSQMQDFAKASQLLLQPGQSQREYSIMDVPTVASSTSPYGDSDLWDLLWLGHCGSTIPDNGPKSGSKIPTGRVAILNDVTVPEPQHIRKQWGTNKTLAAYPPHTRLVSRSKANVCTLAYGITQRGARRILYELGVRKLNDAMDIMLRQLCEGSVERPMLNCLSVQPTLFDHHRPVAAKSTFSEIGGHGDGYNDQAFTYNIRHSTKLNFPKLVAGETDYIDLFKDGEPYMPLESEKE